MMSRWGLEGMQSFAQKSVERKDKLGKEHVTLSTPDMTTAEGGAHLS
jgi:hypothetical protein